MEWNGAFALMVTLDLAVHGNTAAAWQDSALTQASKIETQACAGAARGGDSRSGKQPGKIQDIHPIREIVRFDLNVETPAFFSVELHSRVCTQRKIRPHAAAIQVYARQNFGPELRQQKIQLDVRGIVEFNGKPAAVLCADCR